MRNSSPPSVSLSIVKGGVFDGFKMSKDSASISTSPVERLGFLETRSITVP